MKIQYQYLTEDQRKDLLNLFQKSKYFFNGTLITWKTDPVES